MLIRAPIFGIYVSILTAMLCPIVAGCGGTKGTTSNKSENRKQIDASELRESEIKAGWGILPCHIGMTIDDCIESLGDPDAHMLDRDIFADGTMSWYELGVMVAFKDDAVVQVYFDYLSYEYDPFPGRLYPATTPSSPMSAVTAKYGPPEDTQTTRVSNWQAKDKSPREREFFAKHFAGRMETCYNYPTLGIDVCFVNEKVEYVRVYVPQP